MLLFVFRSSAGGGPAERSGGYITVSDGVDLYVTMRGQGAPCLYIHGGPGSGSHWLEKFSGEMLERRFTMVYLDQRGVCRSKSPENNDFSAGRIVEDFEEVRKALGVDAWITLGHSMGGILQMEYARRHPEVILGMMMVNCTLNVRRSLEESWAPKALEITGCAAEDLPFDETAPVLERVSLLGRKLAERNLMWKMGYAAEESKMAMDATFDDIPGWNHDFERVALEGEDFWRDCLNDTAGFGMPVLFFYGRSDWMVGPLHYRDVRFPRLVLWGSDCGHVPFIENPADLERAIDSYRIAYGL